MKLVVGLGNPGPQYEHTRHNVGFRVVDRLATKWGWKWSERRGKAIMAGGLVGTEKVVLVKPLTFMNLSGEAVGDLVHWFKLEPGDLLVVYDELDLPIGKVRMRAKGSAAGHNGMRDIMAKLHTNDVPRLRVGIGQPRHERIPGRDHVLSTAKGDDGILLSSGEERAAQAVEMLLAQGLDATMNAVNADPEEAAQKAEEQARKKREREARLQREREERAKRSQDQETSPDGDESAAG